MIGNFLVKLGGRWGKKKKQHTIFFFFFNAICFLAKAEKTSSFNMSYLCFPAPFPPHAYLHLSTPTSSHFCITAPPPSPLRTLSLRSPPNYTPPPSSPPFIYACHHHLPPLLSPAPSTPHPHPGPRFLTSPISCRLLDFLPLPPPTPHPSPCSLTNTPHRLAFLLPPPPPHTHLRSLISALLHLPPPRSRLLNTPLSCRLSDFSCPPLPPPTLVHAP